MFCENCEIEYFNKYGSGRFCGPKCARCYSTKSKRAEINRKVSLSIRKTSGTEFLTCPSCQISFSWEHFANTAENLGTKETKFCSKSCKLAARKAQSSSPEFRQKMSDAAVRRIERGEVWFGKQNFIDAFGKTIRCDSLLERSFVLLMSRNEKVKDVRRSEIWIPYNESGITRRYNPDFIVEFVDGSLSIAEVKSERAGKNDVWEDYRLKSLTKRSLLENYAKNHNMKCIWFTQLTSPQTYKEVCTIHSF
jgi:hypothetical protein